MPSRAASLIASFALLGFCAASSAQNALGDGRALDNNLNIRGRYNTARPTIARELAFRNAIVTGNAPGGMSFRGDIGYRAPGEFEGELGANDLFSFRRDSLRSGMAGMGIRGTEALQYQLALTTGSRPPANLVGRFTVTRFGVGDTAENVRTLHDPDSQAGLRQRPAIDPDADDRGTMLWMLRSPSAYMSNSALQASSMRTVRGRDSGIYTMIASPLRGVRLSPVPELADRNSNTGNTAEPGADQTGDNPTDNTNGSFGGGQGGGQTTDQQDGQAGDQTAVPVRTLHGDIIRQINEQQDPLSAGPTISDRVREILGALAGRKAAQNAEDAEGQPEEKSIATDRIHFDPQTMRMLHGDGTPLTDYVNPADVHRNVYAENLHAGQELMAKGRYFDAEERFAQALAIRRGDITAQIARFHAQIGAGLFLSASLNMQSLALSRPEVFAVKYGQQLLPSPERLDDLTALLRETMDDSTKLGREASPRVRQAAGLLLAYIGFQQGHPELVKEGLDDYIARATAGLNPGDPLPIEARLGEMFRAMWLLDETKPTPPASAEKPESTGKPAPRDEGGDG